MCKHRKMHFLERINIGIKSPITGKSESQFEINRNSLLDEVIVQFKQDGALPHMFFLTYGVASWITLFASIKVFSLGSI